MLLFKGKNSCKGDDVYCYNYAHNYHKYCVKDVGIFFCCNTTQLIKATPFYTRTEFNIRAACNLYN